MTISGAPVSASATYDVIDPATGQATDSAPLCNEDQLDEAMASAAAAFEYWSTDRHKRRACLYDLADAMDSAQDELTDLLSSETGKPRAVSEGEVSISGLWLRHFADLELPDTVLKDDEHAAVVMRNRPMGVVATITPWNGPVALLVWKLAPALRAGNTVVAKPSPYTPLSSLRIGEICGEVLPPGVVNMINGGDEIGEAMVRHPVPRKVSFTGSVEAGSSVAGAAGATMKHATLELGGNDAAIVLDDADFDFTVASLLALSMFNCGQICCIPKRIFVPSGRYDEYVDAFAAGARAIILGPPDGADTQMGPLTTAPQLARVKDLVSDAIASGARLACGGRQPDRPGYFFEPTVVANVEEGVRLVDEEQFGPVIPLLRYDSVDEAILRANKTSFGLGGSVWSTDSDRATRIARRLECGTAWINTHAVLAPFAPFGGMKSSGLGAANGLPGLLAFTEYQVIHEVRAAGR